MIFEFKTYSKDEIIVSVKTMSDIELKLQSLQKELQEKNEAIEKAENLIKYNTMWSKEDKILADDWLEKYGAKE